MRMLLKAQMATDAGNTAIQKGTMGGTWEKVLGALKPEAAYFTVDGGKRTAFIVFDLKDVSDMPVAAESLFIELGASIDLTPAMTPDDLRKGLAKLA
jgi:hypothetical protein